MKILAIDTSARAASAAIMSDGKLIGEYFINTNVTHSKTLMPMIENLLYNTGLAAKDIDLFAASAGPGSFTGIRIGVCAIKGIAYALRKPCVSISTLEAIAHSAGPIDAIVYSVMDARCGQVYNAVFEVSNSNFKRLTEDRAISIKNLLESIEYDCKTKEKPILLVGDGADMCYNSSIKAGLAVNLAFENMVNQRASCVASLANRCDKINYITAKELNPTYLRLPQAQRELKNKQGLKGVNIR